MSARLKLCLWPSLKMITIVPGASLGFGGVLAKALGSIDKSNPANPVARMNLRMILLLAVINGDLTRWGRSIGH
jgi:hypothetical protein